jgi:glucokinase
VELCLAIDVGGTKMAAGFVSRDGQLVCDTRIPTPPTDNAETLFTALAGVVKGVLGEVSSLPGGRRANAVVVCGVGCGGPMSMAEGKVSPLNIPAWRDFPLRERLSDLIGLSVSVDNDAKALTLGEGWTGAARGRRDFIGMVVSTGVGGGIVLEGRLLDGASGNAGHVGHVIVEPDGRVCPCGARGCLEAEASGRAIAMITGHPPSEAPALIVERTGRMVGRAVASVSSLLDLETAVVAGSVALGFGSLFFAAANAELRERARLSFSKSARVVPAGLGASAPLVGAGAVGWRSAGREVLTCPT